MVRLVVARPRQVVRRTGTALYPFTLQGAADRVEYRVDVDDPQLRVDWAVDDRASGGHALTLQAEPGRRLPVGDYALTFAVYHAGETHAVGLVLEVKSCLEIGKGKFSYTSDTATLTVPVSTRCVFGYHVSGNASYNHSETDGDGIDITAGAGPFEMKFNIPLDGSVFTEEDVEITLHAGEGTEISWRPGEDPQVTWAPIEDALCAEETAEFSEHSRWARFRRYAVPAGVGVLLVALGIGLAALFAGGGTNDSGSEFVSTADTTRPCDPSTTEDASSQKGKLPDTGPRDGESGDQTGNKEQDGDKNGGNNDDKKVVGDKVEPELTVQSASPSASVSQPVTVRATVASTAGGPKPTGTVEITEGSTSLGSRTLSDGAAAIVLPVLSRGVHELTVAYSGDSYYAPTTRRMEQEVSGVVTTLTLAVTKEFVDCESGELTATVTAADGSAPGGDVVFTIDGVEMAPVPLSGGTARIQKNFPDLDPHQMAARYAGDATHGGDDDSTTVTSRTCIT